jgi:hypothetical protein
MPITKENYTCNEWLPDTKLGKSVIIIHIIIVFALSIITGVNYNKVGGGVGGLIGSLLGTIICGVIGYYYMYSMWCCGGIGGKIILVPTILFEILFIIGLILYFSGTIGK